MLALRLGPRKQQPSNQATEEAPARRAFARHGLPQPVNKARPPALNILPNPSLSPQARPAGPFVPLPLVPPLADASPEV